MPGSESVSDDAPTPYIRGSVVTGIDGRRVLRTAIWVCVPVLALIAVATGIGAANQNSTQSRLQEHGVPVSVTVTGCLQVTSGIGQAVNYYKCNGDFVLDGRKYNSVIGGTRSNHPVGQSIAAVTVRGDPSVVSTASAVAKKFSRWTPYVTPVILALLTVVLAALMVVTGRRARRRADAVAGS